MHGNKCKVLIGCLFFKSFTGSELYVYELARNLVKLDCDVTVASPYVGGEITDLAILNGVRVVNISALSREHYDVIHTQHKPITNFLVNKFPSIKKISSIHSEIIALEEPVIHESIKHYIAIRPQIKEFLIEKHNVPCNKISVIYNPIDEERFKVVNVENHNSVLFVGTLDYLRKNAIFDLIDYSKKRKMDFWLIGENNDDYLNEILQHEHVRYSKPVSDVEKYFQRCNETAGILLGRTTIEGWMCGKSGWIYNVNESGKILGKELHHPPNDIRKFFSSEVARRIRELY
jgi:glycosyltransferase involved in cell wall biosynthesis